MPKINNQDLEKIESEYNNELINRNKKCKECNDEYYNDLDE